MGVNIKECRKFTIDDFSGGLNESASSYDIADNELVSCKNISLRKNGSISSARGFRFGNTQGPSIYVHAVRGAHRYTASDGTRQVIVYGSDSNEGSTGLYATNSSDQFEKVGTFLADDDGRCRFAQYRDTVFASGRGDDVKFYDTDNDFKNVLLTDFEIRLYSGFDENGDPIYTRPESLLDVTTEDGEGNIDMGVYHYRLTLDYGGKNFFGETSPLVLVGSYSGSDDTKPVYVKYIENTVTISGATLDDDVLFSKPVNGHPLGPDVQRINIYRSAKQTSAIENSSVKDIEVFYIGSIEKSTYNNADDEDVLFRDAGIVPGATASYGKSQKPPRARFIEYHKDRMWSGNVYFEYGQTAKLFAGQNELPNIMDNPHAIMFSEVNNHGNSEPMCYRADYSIEINPNDGEGITGMKSYRNNILVVFKANSTWAITGDNPDNFSKRNIDPRIGCVAPETIDIVDGRLVWLSNAGLYYFDGSRVLPFKTDEIRKSIEDIPATAKKRACGIYDVGRREYLLSHAGNNDYNGGKNHKISRFDLRTGSWVQEHREFATTSFFQKNMPNEKIKTYSCTDFIVGASITNPATVELNNGYIGYSSNDLDFSFQTKFFSDGTPYMNKNFRAVFFELVSPEELTLDVVCDNRMDTRKDDGGGFTIPVPVTNDLIWYDSGSPSSQQCWYLESGGDNVTTFDNTNVWAEEVESGVLVHLDSRCWGKRISLIISGSVRSAVEIQSITVFYDPREGVRQ
jgi:hypothetical protein